MTEQEKTFSQMDPRVVQRPPGVDGVDNLDPFPGRRPVERYSPMRAAPGGWYEKNLSTTASTVVGGAILLLDDSLGFPAHSVLVDNWTSQWVEIDGVRRSIPPYSGGWVFNIGSGTQQARVRLKTPSAVMVQATAIAGETLWVAFAEAVIPPATGIFLPGGAIGGTLLGTVRVQDGVTATLLTISAAADAANQGNPAQAATFGQLFNGVNWDRVREASAANLGAQSGLGAALATPPGEWGIFSSPVVANTLASVSRAASAGVRHIARGASGDLVSVGVPAVALQQVTIRDGPSGVGTSIWARDLVLQAISGYQDHVTSPPLNLVGTAGNAMTIEFTTAGGANSFEAVSLNGFDAS